MQYGNTRVIDARIKRLIDAILDDDKATARLVRNERRWLGIEGASKSKKFAITTVKSYLTEYRNAVLDGLPTPDKYWAKADALVKKYTRVDLTDIADREASSMQLLARISTHASMASGSNPELYTALKKLKPSHKSFNMLKLNRHQTHKIKTDYLASTVAKVHKQLVINRADIDGAINRVLNGDEYTRAELLIALMLATGRRPVELLAFGNFSVISNEGCTSSIRMDGVAKATYNQPSKSVEFPTVGIDPELIPGLVERLRSMFGTNSKTSGAEVNKLTCALGDKVRRVLDNNSAVLYSCRAIYAELAYIQYGGTQNQNAYKAKILGHDATDLTTVNTYSHVVISDKSCTPFVKKAPKSLSKPSKRAHVPMVLLSIKKQAEAAGGAVLRIWEFAASNDVELTQSALSRAGGFGRQGIKKFMLLLQG